MTNLSELAARIEAADADEQRAMLEATWIAIHGVRPCNVSQEHHDWLMKYLPFQHKLDAEAYESAALSLVPEGAFWSITMRSEKRGGFHACCQFDGPLDWREAATPALAILAAALRAKEVSDHG